MNIKLQALDEALDKLGEEAMIYFNGRIKEIADKHDLRVSAGMGSCSVWMNITFTDGTKEEFDLADFIIMTGHTNANQRIDVRVMWLAEDEQEDWIIKQDLERIAAAAKDLVQLEIESQWLTDRYHPFKDCITTVDPIAYKE